MTSFGKKSPLEVTLLCAAIAFFFSLRMGIDELNAWGNFITAIGSILLILSSQQQFYQKKDASSFIF